MRNKVVQDARSAGESPEPSRMTMPVVGTPRCAICCLDDARPHLRGRRRVAVGPDCDVAQQQLGGVVVAAGQQLTDDVGDRRRIDVRDFVRGGGRGSVADATGDRDAPGAREVPQVVGRY